jgi:hypothetical protein
MRQKHPNMDNESRHNRRTRQTRHAVQLLATTKRFRHSSPRLVDLVCQVEATAWRKVL